MKVTKVSDGTRWPTVEEACDLSWLARYGSEDEKRDALLSLAEVAHAYACLVMASTRKRAMVVRDLMADGRKGGG